MDMTYGKCIVKGLMDAKANRNNFYKNSICNYVSCDTPKNKPDYISESGSMYWYTDDGVYRNSDHWGGVATCSWHLDGTVWPDWNRRTGFCHWDDFRGTTKSVEMEMVVAGKVNLKVGKKFLNLNGLKLVEILSVGEMWTK